MPRQSSGRRHCLILLKNRSHVLGVEKLEAVAGRGYYSGEEILACDKFGVEVTLPKPMTSGLEAKGRFGKQDFAYLRDENACRCPAGEKLTYHHTMRQPAGDSRTSVWHHESAYGRNALLDQNTPKK